MNPRIQPEPSAWRNLYTVAVTEPDHGKLAARIAAAESEIVKRGRALFGVPGNHAVEAEALDLALGRLRMLKSLSLHTALEEVASIPADCR